MRFYLILTLICLMNRKTHNPCGPYSPHSKDRGNSRRVRKLTALVANGVLRSLPRIEEERMIKLSLRAVAVSSLLVLSSLFVAPMALAHVIKHHHAEPQSHYQAEPTIIQLMIKALATPAPQLKATPHTHTHAPTYKPKPAPAPAPVSVMKVHADMCVKGTSWLNARSGPSTNHRVVAELGEGQRIHVTTCQPSKSGNVYWCRAEMGYGKVAYVSKKYLAACELSYRNYR